MKIIKLTESDLFNIVKRVIKEQKPDSMMPWQIEKFGYKQGKPETVKPALEKQSQSINSVVQWCLSHKEMCYTVGEVGLWFVPIIGPLLSAVLGMVQGIDYMIHGRPILGVIYFMLSPLMISKSIRLFKLIDPTMEAIPVLEKINKLGIPVLMTQGQQAFFKWLDDTFEPNVKKQFLNLLNHPEILKDYDSIYKSKIKPEIEKIKNDPKLYDKLSGKQKNRLNII